MVGADGDRRGEGDELGPLLVPRTTDTVTLVNSVLHTVM